MFELQDITKTFDNKTVLNSFNYSFDSTGIYLLRGKSGVGKTTLLRIMGGLDREFTGRISPVKSVSFLFQEYRLFPWLTALQNASVSIDNLPSCEKEKIATNMLLDLGFSPTDLHLKPHELSGGMKARVSLVRAFIKPADILLLDEPTKELDIELVRKVCDIIKTLGQNRLVIISTHDELEDYLQTKGIINL